MFWINAHSAFDVQYVCCRLGRLQVHCRVYRSQPYWFVTPPDCSGHVSHRISLLPAVSEIPPNSVADTPYSSVLARQVSERVHDSESESSTPGV